MRTYSVLLLDDEHLALQLLENFCAQPDPDLSSAVGQAPERLAFRLLLLERLDYLSK